MAPDIMGAHITALHTEVVIMVMVIMEEDIMLMATMDTVGS